MIRFRRKWVVTVTAFSALALVPLSLRYYKVHQASEQLKEIQQLGEPITFAGILEQYTEPSHDATRPWLEGFSLLTALPDENLETLNCLPFVGFADEPTRDRWTDIALAEKSVEQRSKADACLQAATDMGGEGRFPVDATLTFCGFVHPRGLLDAHKGLRAAHLLTKMLVKSGDNVVVEREKAPGPYWFTIALHSFVGIVIPLVFVFGR